MNESEEALPHLDKFSADACGRTHTYRMRVSASF